MDKKILLGGAAALIMGASFLAAPASAAIEITHSGEAKLTAIMSDHCNLSDANLGDNADFSHASADTALVTLAADECVGNEESPLWSTSSKLDWSASGTLANGLSVSVDQDAAIGLSGAFGSVTFKNGGDSAAKSAMVHGQGDIDVAGANGIGGHSVATAGTAGTVVTYQAPSMGGMDLYVSYAPNSARDDTDADPLATDNSEFTDTIGIGAAFSMDALSISAGWESATQNVIVPAVTCLATAGDKTLAVTSANGAVAEADTVSGGTVCGDQTLMMFGAAMTAGELSINAGYSKLDSEEADLTTMNIGLGMDVGAYNLTLDYVDSTKGYLDTAVSDKQTVIGVGASTSLGDGVDLGLSFSNNSYNVAGTGAHTNYRAGAELKITY
jgi:hypothetical protein